MAEHKMISVRGAREHNLKNVDLDIPRDSLTIEVWGVVSGCVKLFLT